MAWNSIPINHYKGYQEIEIQYIKFTAIIKNLFFVS